MEFIKKFWNITKKNPKSLSHIFIHRKLTSFINFESDHVSILPIPSIFPPITFNIVAIRYWQKSQYNEANR